MPSIAAEKKSVTYLWLSILWGGVVAVCITLISTSSIAQWRILVLAITGALCALIAAYMHGWTKPRMALIFVIVGIALGAIGWQARPQPRLAVVELRISSSGFPIPIPPHSITSILRLHPNVILSDAKDYLLKDVNSTSKEFLWPSQDEIDSRDTNDHETVFQVEIINHSEEVLASGKLLFQVAYNTGLPGGGCMPAKEKQEYQKDFVLLPQLDPGKSFDFYAINQSPSCVWLIPPETAVIKLVSDDADRQISLTWDKNPLYASGAPVFPPTKIKWEALPTRPNSYQIQRIVN